MAVMAGSRQSSPGNRDRIALTRVLQVAERQWGVIAGWQLEHCGVSRSAISRWVAAGRLHRIYRRVYAVGHRAISTEGRLLAAILYSGPGAALSHASAAQWWGLLPYLPSSTHVWSPVRRRPQRRVVVHHAKHIDRVMRRGLPVTPVAKTLLDFASVAALDRVRKAVAEADFQRLLELDAIDAITGVGRPGSARLSRALALHRPQYARTLSPLEDLLLDLCRRHRLPLPEVNVTVCGYKVDALWRDERVIVELDGKSAHDTRGQGERDRDRDLVLRAAGYCVLRYTWRQVTSEHRAVAADIRRALKARGALERSTGLSTP
jgi:very-short-patch-repair endonuclease